MGIPPSVAVMSGVEMYPPCSQNHSLPCGSDVANHWPHTRFPPPVASQQAPPRPGILRSFDTRTVHTAGPSRYTNGVIGRSEDEVESMGTMIEADRLRDDADRNGAARVRRTATPRSRKPTPLQTARWKAVQRAKRKGLSIRGIARELSIHRDTARKYMNAESPPMSPARATSAGALVC